MNARFSPTRLKVLGSGSALPGSPVSNDQLLRALENHCGKRKAKRAGRIAKLLGIHSRHVSRDLEKTESGALDGSTAPELCHEALRNTNALNHMSYLIGHTSTPHTLLPPNIAWTSDLLSYEGPYVELRQACTGFANALMFAAAMIAEDKESRIGIVGSENGSPFFNLTSDFADLEQLVNFVQMGDGAGAILLGADDGSESHIISDIYFGQSGMKLTPGISLEGGGSAQPQTKHGFPIFRHRASDVSKHGEQLIAAGIKAISERGYQLEDFDWIIPHQANGLMADIFEEKFPGLGSRVFVTADRYGNLGSAAIWVGLDSLRQSGKLESGQKVLILGAEASKYLYGGFVYTH